MNEYSNHVQKYQRMNALVKFSVYILLVCALASCQTLQESNKINDTFIKTKRGTRTVSIITDPPGRKIMVNDEYIGISPVSVELPVFDNKYDSISTVKMKERYTIEAYPEAGDAQSQVKILELVECDECGEAKPFRIFFDMSLSRIIR